MAASIVADQVVHAPGGSVLATRTIREQGGYGLGVSLRKMLDPAAAQACVPVAPDEDAR